MSDQLALKLTAQTLTYASIPLDLIDPHPLNPRPYSETYGCRVDEEKVGELIHSIGTNGYDESEPIKVRPIGDRYQMIRGHHRWVACQQLSHETIPGVVREMTDEQAVIALITEQGRPVEGWEAANHIHAVCASYGQGGLLTVSEYAERVGKTQAAISQSILAVKVKLKCISMLIHFESEQDYEERIAPRTSTRTGGLKEDDWPTAIAAFVENGWTSAQLEAALKAIKTVYELDAPAWMSHLIDLEKLKRAAIEDGKPVRDAQSCINSALEAYESLSQEDVELPSGEDLIEKTRDLKSEFITAVGDLKSANLTPGKFGVIANRLNAEIADLRVKAERWKAKRAKGKERERLLAEQAERNRELAAKYASVGLPGDIRKSLIQIMSEQGDSFDLVLTDPPYLLSNDGITSRSGKQVPVNKNFADSSDAIAPESWLPLCLQLLKPGGVLVFTCTEHLGITAERLERQGYEYLEKLYWIKRSAPPRLTPTGHRACVEEIWVCRKPGETHFFNYELLKEKYWNDKQASSYLEFEQCSGGERLRDDDGKPLHDTQKPLSLWTYLLEAYSDMDARVLDPFAGTATTAIACKQNQRVCTWCELDERFFEKAQSRIDETPFFFEED